MNRRSTNAKKTFTSTTDAYSKELQASLSNRRAEMDSSWDALEDGWKEIEEQMAIMGITEPVSLDGDDLLSLNVGGLHLNVRRTVLESLHQKLSNTTPWTLADLFSCVWDARVPRDRDGRIFLDESPTIMKYLIHTKLKASTKAQGIVRSSDLSSNPAALSPDQRNYLHSFSGIVLGLPNVPLYQRGIATLDKSKILTEDELGQLSVLLRSWCPGDPQCLKLIYRGSRDGLGAKAFHDRCTDKSPSTLTLVKVNHAASGSCSSVIGGFSSVSWVSSGSRRSRFYCETTDGYIDYASKDSPDAFIFMVKDGSATGQEHFQPVRWELPRGSTSHAVIRCGSALGPDFGNGGFRVSFTHSHPLSCHFIVEGSANITGTKASQFRNLSGEHVSEIEVYRVSNAPATPIVNDTFGMTEGADEEMVETEQVDNSRLFGDSIAGSLMEERMALLNAKAELALARKKVEATASALVAVYGPDIASGKPDPVVELSVRGARMTTLRSTLQVCPESALAARFDESKWPVDGRDFGVIDCSPSSFSKVLDVLRLRKRAKWPPCASLKKGAKFSRVQISVGDRVSFEEFIGMYFPGCESFVTDWVWFMKS